MSPATNVKTLKIDGRDYSARADETILDVARQHGIFIPRLCELEGLSTVGACRLCLVEVKGSNRLMASCVTRVDEGMEVTTTSERLGTLRIADLVAEAGHHPHPLSLSLSAGRGGCLARALCHRSEPLHFVYPLRAGLRRDRRGAHLGPHGPRHRLQGHHRPRPALGVLRYLHQLRQVRTCLSDWGAV